MYAIIKSGGKQYRVEKDRIITVEKLIGDVGTSVEIKDVLLLSAGGEKGNVVVGRPLIEEACVHAEIIRQDLLPKIRVFKKKRRKNYRRTFGHRQPMTWLRIDDITIPESMFPDLSGDSPVSPAAKTATDTTESSLEKVTAGNETEDTPDSKVAVPATTKEIVNNMPAAKTTVAEQDPDSFKELHDMGEATEKRHNHGA